MKLIGSFGGFVGSAALAAFVVGCASNPVPAAAPRVDRTQEQQLAEPAASPVDEKITPPNDDFVQFAVQEKPAKKSDKKDDQDAPAVPAASMRPEKSAQGKLQFQR